MTRGLELLESFFDEFLTRLPTASPSQISELMFQAEMTFRRTGYRDEISAGVENILVVRLDEFGDIILTSGFLREVRKNFPSARITVVVKPLSLPLVEFCPYVNEILTFDQNSLDRNFPTMLKTLVDFCRKNLWRKRFSLAFLPKWDGDQMPGLLLAWLSGARERIGYGEGVAKNWTGLVNEAEDARDNFLLARNILTPRSVMAMAARNFYLLESVGLRVDETHMELFFSTEDFLHAQKLLQAVPSNCKKILLGISASGGVRRYPVEKYLVALKELAKKNFVFVIVGGKSEVDEAAYVEKNLPRGKVFNFTGKTTLRETEAVISQMDFYLGNDTGIMHMAAAAQIPVLVLYQEAKDRENVLPGIFSSYRKFPPWQTKFVALRPEHPLGDCAKLPPTYTHCHCNFPHCITQITPQEILDGFAALEKL